MRNNKWITNPQVDASQVAFREEARGGERHVHGEHTARDGHVLVASARFRSTLEEATEAAVEALKRVHGDVPVSVSPPEDHDGETFITASYAAPDGREHRVQTHVQRREHVERVLMHEINLQHHKRYHGRGF